MKLTLKGGAAVDPDSGEEMGVNRVGCQVPWSWGTRRVPSLPLPWGQTLRSSVLTGLEHNAHVLEKGGKVFSATLGLVDIVKGTNSYYKLQLLEDDKESRFARGRGSVQRSALPRAGPLGAGLSMHLGTSRLLRIIGVR